MSWSTSNLTYCRACKLQRQGGNYPFGTGDFDKKVAVNAAGFAVKAGWSSFDCELTHGGGCACRDWGSEPCPYVQSPDLSFKLTSGRLCLPGGDGNVAKLKTWRRGNHQGGINVGQLSRGGCR